MLWCRLTKKRRSDRSDRKLFFSGEWTRTIERRKRHHGPTTCVQSIWYAARLRATRTIEFACTSRELLCQHPLVNTYEYLDRQATNDNSTSSGHVRTVLCKLKPAVSTVEIYMIIYPNLIRQDSTAFLHGCRTKALQSVSLTASVGAKSAPFPTHFNEH